MREVIMYIKGTESKNLYHCNTASQQYPLQGYGKADNLDFSAHRPYAVPL